MDDLNTINLGNLQKGFRCIVADPPWPYRRSWDAAPRAHRPNDKPYPMPYPQLTVKAICAMPVAELADTNCELYLWVTQRFLPDAFKVLAAWGFTYCQTLTWCKAPRGLGQGGLYCPTTEFIILGRKGVMPHRRRLDTTWWQIKRPHNQHSAKPEFFQDIIEEMSDAPRLELFARRSRPGWVSWGNEIDPNAAL